MTLKIEFSTVPAGDGQPSPQSEAGALMALLITLYPDAGDAAVAGLTTVSGPTIDLTDADLDRIRATLGDMPEGTKVERLAAAYVAPETQADTTTFDSPPPNSQTVSMSPAQAFGAPAVGTPVPQSPAAAFASSATVPAAPVATPAAPVTAPAPPTADSPAASDATVERDSEGLPWDERIHSGNHKKSANGKWMQRRGVNQLVLNATRAELLAANTARTVAEVTGSGLVPTPPAQVAPPPPPAPTPPVAAPTTAASPTIPQPTASAATPDNGASTGNIVPAPPTASPSDAPAPRPPVAPDAIKRFGDMMSRINAAEKAGTLTAEARDAIKAACGLSMLSDLMRADEATWTTFETMVAEVGV